MNWLRTNFTKQNCLIMILLIALVFADWVLYKKSNEAYDLSLQNIELHVTNQDLQLALRISKNSEELCKDGLIADDDFIQNLLKDLQSCKQECTDAP